MALARVLYFYRAYLTFICEPANVFIALHNISYIAGFAMRIQEKQKKTNFLNRHYERNNERVIKVKCAYIYMFIYTFIYTLDLYNSLIILQWRFNYIYIYTHIYIWTVLFSQREFGHIRIKRSVIFYRNKILVQWTKLILCDEILRCVFVCTYLFFRLISIGFLVSFVYTFLFLFSSFFFALRALRCVSLLFICKCIFALYFFPL